MNDITYSYLLVPYRGLSIQGLFGAPAVPEGHGHVPHPGGGLGTRRTGVGSRVEDRGEWRSSENKRLPLLCLFDKKYRAGVTNYISEGQNFTRQSPWGPNPQVKIR